MKILLVEDEEIERVSLQDELISRGYDTLAVASPPPALALLDNEIFDLVLTDFRMPGMDGMQFLKKIREREINVEVIIMTAYGNVQHAVQAMKLGAFDYITKPFQFDELLQLLSRLKKMRSLEQENRQLRQQLKDRHGFGSIIGKSPAMQNIYQQLEIIAPSDTTVLITGETGTGKEVIANAIHYNSLRNKGPFLKVSCAILSNEILESELFGHVRGAFTGATNEKKGRFELANGGSIFLDDIDDVPIELQVKLLRVLQEKEFERVGSAEVIKTDVRVIASTKKDLYQQCKAGLFREDLYYRLNIIPLNLPPLRERREDIPLLANHFMKEFLPENPLQFGKETMAKLIQQPWEGNVRELHNAIERLSIVCRCNPIIPECLNFNDTNPTNTQQVTVNDLNAGFSLEQAIGQLEQSLIDSAMVSANGNKAKAAEMLFIPVSTLKSKLKKYVG